jgi:hypothetical protein
VVEGCGHTALVVVLSSFAAVALFYNTGEWVAKDGVATQKFTGGELGRPSAMALFAVGDNTIAIAVLVLVGAFWAVARLEGRAIMARSARTGAGAGATLSVSFVGSTRCAGFARTLRVVRKRHATSVTILTSRARRA